MAYNLRPRPGIQVETLGPLEGQEFKESSANVKNRDSSNSKILLAVVLFRWINVALVQTSFVPDEYWQSLEVAHNMVFGYGYLTWEWQTGLRGYTYPAMFAALYKCLAVLKLDYPLILITAPRLLQATLSAVGDFCLYKTSCNLHGKSVGKWTLILNLGSWFVFYTATRTLTNTMESILTAVGLYFFPWPLDMLHNKKSKPRSSYKYILVVAVACIVRPTAVVLWFPLCIWHINSRRISSINQSRLFPVGFAIIIMIIDVIRVAIVLFLPIGFLAISYSLLVDRLFYGKWIFVQWNFVEFNFIHDFGAFYGSHPWHWYFTQGFPVVVATHIPSFIMGARMGYRKHGILLIAVLWALFIYSFTSHKEFRFILPVVPICMLFCGLFMEDMHSFGKTRFLIIYLLLNLPPAVYFGLFHQRGVLDVMGYVRQVADEHTAGHERSVLFLMPCHSTPYYSFIHSKLPMRFLECPPNLNQEPDYVEETSLFYKNPVSWLQQEYQDRLPTHLIFFDVLKLSIQEFLEEHQYTQTANYFHTHLPEGRMGGRIYVFAREEQKLLEDT